jgi:hypothetical protein
LAIETRIEVHGLRELDAAFGKARRDLPRELAQHLSTPASRIAGRVSSVLPHRSGAAAASVRPRSSASAAGVEAGSGIEYYPWLDFGGSVGRGGKIDRPFSGKGRYLYPAIESEGRSIEEHAEDAVMAAARDAGFEVRR